VFKHEGTNPTLTLAWPTDVWYRDVPTSCRRWSL